MFKYLLYKFGQFCVNHLSPNAAYAMAAFISDWQYRLSFRDRQAVRHNLKIILGRQDHLEPETREVFRNFGRYLVDFFRMNRHVDKEFIQENVRIINRGHIDRVLAEGKGGIILTAHIGNWELGGVILSLLGYPVVGIALPHKERQVNRLFNQQRELKGMTIVQTTDAMRVCLEAIRNNKLVGVLADRDFTASGEILDFLGRKAFIPKGPAIFSKKTGAPIIPVFFVRENDGTFTLTCEAPMYPVNDSFSRKQEKVNNDKEEAERLNLIPTIKQYAAIIEQKIRQHPTQWLMFREFWVK